MVLREGVHILIVLSHIISMDCLMRLQSVQYVLRTLQDHSLSSADTHEDRFLVDFLLFLVATCKDAEEMVLRSRFLLGQLPKVLGTTLLQELAYNRARKGLPDHALESSRWGQSIPDLGTCSLEPLAARNPRKVDVTREFVMNLESPSVCLNKRESFCNKFALKFQKPKGQLECGVPLVGLRAMEHAKSTLEDFCKSYFMFHDMDACNTDHLFRYLPALQFVESYIYQLDRENEERLLSHPGDEVLHQVSDKDVVLEISTSENPFGPLEAALAERNWLTERIENEFKDGREYWALELALCRALIMKEKISISDVLKASRLKSFDYRVLNLLLYRLTNKLVDEMHMEFLSVSEFLVEVSDDLFDYEDDVWKNNFNILRMFVRIYGQTDAPSMLVGCISEAEEKYQLLLKKLEPGLATRYQRRCKEAVIEGGNASKHSMGTWIIPPLILDEEAYRSQVNAH
eukprot:c23088_g1_i3 orf=484-1860(-)